MLGAITVFIIDRNFVKAAAFSLASAALTFFGFMHGEAIGIGQTPTVAFAYLMVACVLFACAKFSVVDNRAPEPLEHGHAT
jgi:AGZA family xanthine/uracil permease-like MFS transporter